MSTPYMSGFQEQVLRLVDDVGDGMFVPSTFRPRSTARRGAPRIRWTPKRRPRVRQRSASGLNPLPPTLDGKRLGAGSSRPWSSSVGTGLGGVLVAAGAGLVPLDVDGQDVVAGGQQLAGHDLGLLQVWASVMVVAKLFQLFQPIGGVGARSGLLLREVSGPAWSRRRRAEAPRPDLAPRKRPSRRPRRLSFFGSGRRPPPIRRRHQDRWRSAAVAGSLPSRKRTPLP
jgi:hypothetical protein